MCHEHGARNWVWEPEEEETDEPADDEPEFLNEESDTTTELVTDGGDEQ